MDISDCLMEKVMHKIGIISDTHGLLRPEVTEILTGCDVILHGGDINSLKILDALGQIAPVHVVRGNNDKEWAKDLPEKLVLNLYGIRFFMVHNKKYIPKEKEDTGNADIIIYGHSHKFEEKYEDGRLYLNPGSCGLRRFTQPVTFAVLEVGEDGSCQVKKVEIPHPAGEGRTVRGHISRSEADGMERTCMQTEKGAAEDDRSAEAEKAVPEQEIFSLDMGRIVRGVMRDTDRRLSVKEIAAKNGISEELAEQICRLYLTHPGVSVDGILGKMGL